MYTQIHIHRSYRNEDTDGKGVQEYEQGYAYINKHRDVGSIIFVEKKEKKKVVVNVEQNTKHTYKYGDKCV